MIDRRREFWSDMQKLRNSIAADKIDEVEEQTLKLFEKYNLEVIVKYSLSNPIERSVAVDKEGNVYAEWCSCCK